VFINAYDRNILQLIWNLNTRINFKEYVFTHFVFVLQVPILKIKIKLELLIAVLHFRT